MRETDPNRFFIGWSPDWKLGWKKFLFHAFTTIAILTVAFSVLMVLLQPSYKDSSFDFPNISVSEGFLFKSPVPHIVSDDQAILLTGFGKFGALGDINSFEQDLDVSAEGLPVKISGTRIRYDDHTLYELTLGRASLELSNEIDLLALNNDDSGGEQVSLKGEIIDPKCFFGAMNPAVGKIHRSCAIRCIAGGIPAVLIVQNENEDYSYQYLTPPNYQTFV